jgi:cytosine/adenosine deaminase-related metal-dependent hydrolase
MALVIAGTVVPMAPGDESASFKGRVWIGDDGRVDAVTRRGDAAPAGFSTARVVDVADAVIHPGFVDLHSHIGYNFLPLWEEPDEPAPFAHRGIWPNRSTYRPDVAWPAWTLMKLAPESLYAYAQVRALAGGTTAIQGWPSASRPPTNRLVRSIDDDPVGPLKDPISVAIQTLPKEELRRRAQDVLGTGRSFIYHLGEGQPTSLAKREFADLSGPGWSCLQPGFIAIHATTLDAAAFQTWKRTAAVRDGGPCGTIVWSPFSNLWLYQTTARVPDALAAGVDVSLGTDWGPSGTKNLLGEIKVARLWSDHAGWGLTDADLVRMITAAPGDAVGRAWQVPVGRLVPSALGDVTVLTRRHDDVWRNVVTAKDTDVALVVVDGVPRFGTTEHMRAAGAGRTTAVPIGTSSRRVTLVRPDDPTKLWTWSDITAGLKAARTDAAERPPTGPVATGARRTAGPPRRVGDPVGTPPIAVRLDMPGGPGATAGPPPKGQVVDIPPIQPVSHNPKWLAGVVGHGFHAGVLDGLRGFYR